MADVSSITIYSNDGTQMLTSVEGVSSAVVTETGLSDSVYTYTGGKTFLGLSTTVNATVPTYAVGDTITPDEGMTLYIVEALTMGNHKERLEQAKTDLQTWLTDNGVTVPQGALIDGLVGMLGDVEVGGGGVRFSTGSYIPENTTSDEEIIIEHGLGIAPEIALFMLAERDQANTSVSTMSKSYLAGITHNTNTKPLNLDSHNGYVVYNDSKAIYDPTVGINTTGYNGEIDVAPCNANELTFSIKPTSSCRLIGGYNYMWIAIGGV